MNILTKAASFLLASSVLSTAAYAATITVTARGTPAGGEYPVVLFHVNGPSVGSLVTVTGTLKNYTFTVPIAKEHIKSVWVHYRNDAVIGSEDRNLYVESITIDGEKNSANAKNVLFDPGAYGGGDEVQGSSNVGRNGYLIFSPVQLGVFYFPGWHASKSETGSDYIDKLTTREWPMWCGRGDTFHGNPRGNPWCTMKTDPLNPIKHRNFPERQPDLGIPVSSGTAEAGVNFDGWYDDSEPKVVKRQVELMAQNGIDYVVFDYFWSPLHAQAIGDQPLIAYKNLDPNANPPGRPASFRHALLWAIASEDLQPNSRAQLDLALRDIAIELNAPGYLTAPPEPGDAAGIKRPLLFIETIEHLIAGGPSDNPWPGMASRTGFGSGGELLAYIRSYINNYGAKNLRVHLIGNTSPNQFWIGKAFNDFGFDTISAYNYRVKYDYGGNTTGRPQTFAEFKDWYWHAWIISLDKVPAGKKYIPPLGTGEDERPWIPPVEISKNVWLKDSSGNYVYPAVPRSRPKANAADDKNFKRHLQAVIQTLAKPSNRDKTLNTTVICCWNEHGEGQLLEPTIRHYTGAPGAQEDYLGDQLLKGVKAVFVDDIANGTNQDEK